MNRVDADAERKLLRVSEVVTRHLSGEARPDVHRDGKERIAQAIAEERLRRRKPHLVWAIAVGCALLLLIGAGYWGWSLSSARQLSYTVLGGFVSEGGYVNGDGDGVGSRATLRFSDGTEVSFAEGAQGRIAALSARGARIALENGRASLRVTQRPKAAWYVDAGPFVIRVTGTEFDVDWSGIDGTLEVELREGSVVVSGPPAPGGLLLRAGQRLIAQQGHLRVEATALPGAADTSQGLAEAEPGASAHGVEAAVEPNPTIPFGPTWTSRVAAGEHLAVLAEAEERGLERCYAESPLSDLVALADAARAARRSDIARAALMAQRTRFAASGAAHTAAFLLGRLAEETGGSEMTATDWYERYLRETPGGPLAAEALGRKLMVLRSAGHLDGARSAARQYLERYPNGPYAPEARELVALRSP